MSDVYYRHADPRTIEIISADPLRIETGGKLSFDIGLLVRADPDHPFQTERVKIGLEAAARLLEQLSHSVRMAKAFTECPGLAEELDRVAQAEQDGRGL